MICSECKKNPAILFYEKIDNGKSTMEGLCYDCAKKKGIDATEVLAKQQDLLSKDKINFADMNKQLENIFKDFAENLDISNLENAVSNLLGLSVKIQENTQYIEIKEEGTKYECMLDSGEKKKMCVLKIGDMVSIEQCE